MRSERNEVKMSPFEAVVKYLAGAMAVLYIGIGTAILLRAADFFNLPHRYSWMLGLLLIFYGIFRGYKVYQRYFKNSS
ncbi:MAG TPA: hypothetical protein VD816_19165 [Ohtaekwangia sp.]|nr:hypothetical protein [Ohtaekwangia sp.]